jgi:hypothetical protein
MKIVRYELGEQAPHDVDCMKVERRPDGRWSLVGSALVGDESVMFAAAEPYDSAEEAEAAGVAWAEGHGVAELHLEVMPGC